MAPGLREGNGELKEAVRGLEEAIILVGTIWGKGRLESGMVGREERRGLRLIN